MLRTKMRGGIPCRIVRGWDVASMGQREVQIQADGGVQRAAGMARPPGVRAHLDLEVDPQTDGPLTACTRAVNQPEAPSQHLACKAAQQ